MNQTGHNVKVFKSLLALDEMSITNLPTLKHFVMPPSPSATRSHLPVNLWAGEALTEETVLFIIRTLARVTASWMGFQFHCWEVGEGKTHLNHSDTLLVRDCVLPDDGEQQHCQSSNSRTARSEDYHSNHLTTQFDLCFI